MESGLLWYRGLFGMLTARENNSTDSGNKCYKFDMKQVTSTNFKKDRLELCHCFASLYQWPIFQAALQRLQHFRPASMFTRMYHLLLPAVHNMAAWSTPSKFTFLVRLVIRPKSVWSLYSGMECQMAFSSNSTGCNRSCYAVHKPSVTSCCCIHVEKVWIQTWHLNFDCLCIILLCLTGWKATLSHQVQGQQVSSGLYWRFMLVLWQICSWKWHKMEAITVQ